MNDLIAAAKAARLNAYAPYSKFLVGAAVRDERGQIHGGCNIENAAYPQGWCAETSAIAAMITSGGHRIAEMAVIGTGDLLCTPCGGCRQKIREFAKGYVIIHMCGEDGNLKQTFTLDELLPASFGPENLA
ncbi:MAG: cytidine deaminase [Aestuariivirga sp.]|nr:cytidine deaminase [Aestuariivirga sp.]